MRWQTDEKIAGLRDKLSRERGLASPEETVFREACLRLGLPGLIVPKAHGGAGEGALAAAAVMEQLGISTDQRGLAFALAAELFSSTRLLCDFASPELQAEILPEIVRGKVRVAHAATETGAGSDMGALTTRAEPVAGGYVLSGEKRYVTGGVSADYALVYAVTDPRASPLGRLSVFLVPLREPGVQVEVEAGFAALPGAGAACLRLDGVYLPIERRIGEAGAAFLMFAHCMDWERTGLASLYTGILRRLLEKCVGHARERHSMGVPIGRYQSVSHPLARMKADLEAGRALVSRAAAELEATAPAGEAASIAKLFSTEALADAAKAAVGIFGASAFEAGMKLTQLMVDAMAFRVASGTNEVQLNLIAKSMGI
jgi:alkylation response protein AidB-like acyl-CoA dehydrogenase